MEYLIIALVLIGAVLISAVLDQFLARVSLPLVQMIIGVAIYLFVPLSTDLTLNSELFLVMFIAPLLFDESRNVNNRALWVNKNTILSLAIGLVIATVLFAGVVLHLIVPTVTLAAAFAFAAALGPTDAVAVSSLGKSIKLNTRQTASLSGEALLNDASGVVSFQFAIAAAVTGDFSLADAGRTFVVDFVGGIALGLALGLAAFIVMRSVRRAGVESATFHVCFEIFLPFLVYIVASQVHVSGILAVVAAGLLLAYFPQKISPSSRSFETFSTRLSMTSQSVWGLITFVLNGIIFTDLGYVLSSTLAPALKENSANLIWLFGLVLVMTAVIVGIRYAWVLGCDLLSTNPETGKRMKPEKEFALNALVTTLAGPKGAVSLSIASTIPLVTAAGVAFPQRDLLLFLTCGVIVVTLLLANFVVPLIAPKAEEDESVEIDADVEIEILENVIVGLKRQQNAQNKQATGRVMRMYHRRLAAARRKTVAPRQLRFLRQEILVRQRDYVQDAIERDAVDRRLGEQFLKRIERMIKLLMHKKTLLSRKSQTRPIAGATSTMHKLKQGMSSSNSQRRRLEFKIETERIAVDYLEVVSHEPDEERSMAALALLSEHKPLLVTLRTQLRTFDKAQGINVSAPESPLEVQVVRTDTGSLHLEESDIDEPPFMADVQAEALRLELDEIQDKRESGRLPRTLAREMREEIYLLQMGLSD